MDKPTPAFKAIDVEATDEGIVLMHANGSGAQRAFAEGQLRGYSLKLDGCRLTWLLLQNPEPQ
ncbi:MAG: hypothetical protein ACKO7W_14135 [Elainella sp.]